MGLNQNIVPSTAGNSFAEQFCETTGMKKLSKEYARSEK
jgi:hypothetical protein